MLYKNRPIVKKVSKYSMTGNCILDVATLNTKENITNKDLKKLKVYGLDEVSKINRKELRNLITEENYSLIKEHFPYYKDRDSVIRWILRGLSVDLAIRKILLTKESRNFFIHKHKYQGIK